MWCVHICVHVPEQVSIWQSEGNLQWSVLSFYHWPRNEFRLSAFSVVPHFQTIMFVFTHCPSGPRTQSQHLHSPLRALCYIFSSQWNIKEGLVRLEVFSNINIKYNLFLHELNTALNVNTYMVYIHDKYMHHMEVYEICGNVPGVCINQPLAKSTVPKKKK